MVLCATYHQRVTQPAIPVGAIGVLILVPRE